MVITFVLTLIVRYRFTSTRFNQKNQGQFATAPNLKNTYTHHLSKAYAVTNGANLPASGKARRFISLYSSESKTQP